MVEQRHGDETTPRRLAYTATLLVALDLIALFFVPIPDANNEVIFLLSGQIVSGWMLAIGYYYSTTSHSARKDAAIARGNQP